MKISSSKTLLAISMITALLAISACEQKGPMEKAGEKIDQAVDDSGDALNDAGNDLEDAADDAADAVKDATN